MSHISLFLNTRIEGSGTLAAIGDAGLTPLRYLFHGKTVRIEKRKDLQAVEINHIDHVPSFHEDGKYSSFLVDPILQSSPTSAIRTLASIALLIPGIVLSVFKLLSYVFASVRERHQLAKEHFTPINREIGSVANPIRAPRDLRRDVLRGIFEPKHRPTNALIIHGDGQLEIDEDPGILFLKPMKLILDGAQIVAKPSVGTDSDPHLEDEMVRSDKWEWQKDHGLSIHKVSSVEEALRTTAPKRENGKPYHQIFTIVKA